MFDLSKKVKKETAGFTLVEMIVSIGIFTAVMFIATGALLSIVGLNKKAQAQQSAINNLNFALENMIRSIRTGFDYRCEDPSGTWSTSGDFTPQDCPEGGFPNGGSVLVFKSDRILSGDTGQWAFGLKNGRIFKSTNLITGVGNQSLITADEIHISGLKFYVVGTTPGDNIQPKVRVNIFGYAFVQDQTGNPRRVDFSLQTTASQRKLDI